jgi:hypothetical protein
MAEWLSVAVGIDAGGPHLREEEVEGFARNALPEPALAGVEEHLLVCEHCRSRVDGFDRFVADLRAATKALDRLDVIHSTEDGPIALRTRQQGDGTWRAELSGTETQSVGTFASPEEASTHLQRIFYEMFPKHVCNAGCGDAARQRE